MGIEGTPGKGAAERVVAPTDLATQRPGQPIGSAAGEPSTVIHHPDGMVEAILTGDDLRRLRPLRTYEVGDFPPTFIEQRGRTLWGLTAVVGDRPRKRTSADQIVKAETSTDERLDSSVSSNTGAEIMDTTVQNPPRSKRQKDTLVGPGSRRQKRLQREADKRNRS